jgi:hypothetical protein
VVIGNSIIQGLDIRTERILGEIGVMQGLTLEGIYCIREKRVGASITRSTVRYGETNNAVLSEWAVVVKKGRDGERHHSTTLKTHRLHHGDTEGTEKT